MKKHEIEIIVNAAIDARFAAVADNVLGRVKNNDFVRLVNEKTGTADVWYGTPYDDDYSPTRRDRIEALKIAAKTLPREMTPDEFFTFADGILPYITGEWRAPDPAE